MENYELSSENLKQVDRVTSQLKELKEELENNGGVFKAQEQSDDKSKEQSDDKSKEQSDDKSKEQANLTETNELFYEVNNSKVILKMDIVKNYLENIKDKEWTDLNSSDKGAWIMAVQIALRSSKIGGENHDKYGEIVIDGVLGPNTRESVKKFQTDNGCKVDGLPGKETLNKIYDILTGKAQPGTGEQEQSGGGNSDTDSGKDDSGDNYNKDYGNNNGEQGNLGQEAEQSENNEDKPENKENSSINSEKLKSCFEKNATNLSVEKIDGKDFFEISYTDKNSNSKVKGIIPTKWNGDSNIYMPGDRSGIAETMKQKKFKENITDKNSKKARFIFEGDADKINGNQKAARYNNLINNFENMIYPMKSTSNKPKINIIGHSRAGATVNKLIGKYSSISNYIILDGTYGVYNNVMKSSIPGKIFYTNGGGTKKYISNYQNKPNLEVIGDYASLGHEAIVPKVLFDTPSTNQELFA